MTMQGRPAAGTIILGEPITGRSVPRRSAMRSFLRSFFRTRMALPALIVIGLLIFCANFANVVAPNDPVTDQAYAFANKGPSATHLLGADYLGRDILSRVIFGARVSLVVGFVAVGIGLLIGVGTGLVAGFYGGATESVLMRCIDAIWAFPALILALAITSALGRGIVNAMIAIGIVNIPAFARRARLDPLRAGAGLRDGRARPRRVERPDRRALRAAEYRRTDHRPGEFALRRRDHDGGRPQFPRRRRAAADAELGGDLRTGYQYMEINPALAFAPGIAIFITALACNFLGDALRTALDPRLAGRG